MGLNQKQLAQKTMAELASMKPVVGDRGRLQIDKEIRRRDQISRKREAAIVVEADARVMGRHGVDGDDRDLRRALQLFVSDASELVTLSIPGEPRPKERPRFGKGRVFSSKSQKDDQDRLRGYFAEAFGRWPIGGTVAVACLFYRSSQRHVDIDNLVKQVFDAANGIIWHDDAQVTACIETLEVDREHPRIALGVVPYGCSVVRNLNRSTT